MSSIAVGQERIERVLGYMLTKGNFNESSPNLPQRVAILGEANHANQSGLTPNVAQQITSSQQAGQLYGFGSPIHQKSLIYFPSSGGGIGGIPVDVYPQAAAGGATFRIQTLTVTGTATAGGTHYVKIDGRTNVNGQYYAVNIASGDTATQIATKIYNAINAVLGSPVTAALDSPPSGLLTLTTKWKGLTAQSVSIEMDTNSTSIGITYAVAQTTAGIGTPDIAPALTAFGNIWYTWVSSGYGTVTAVMDSLEAFNGVPDKTNPTGRYAGIVFKPIIACIGDTSDDPSTITDARKTQLTIAICPAPASKGLPCEAAANYIVLAARQSQDNPHLDISGAYLPDMPVPADGNIGSMASYTFRDSIVKKGCSTVDLVSGKYQVQSFITTYHPDGEIPPQFRYCRNLQIDFNVRYGYYLLELVNVVDHAICADADVVSATNTIKPKQWKGILSNYALDLQKRALIADSPFMQDSTTVNISTTNPDRLETFFRYKRTGYLRIASSTAEAGFNFGSV
jgi:phage tail sheath gpL-like